MWTVSLRRLTTTTGLCSGKLVQKAIHTSKPVPYVASSSGFLPQLRHHSSTPESSLPPVIGAYPLQQESAQDAPIATGYNLLLQRIANMIVNITEKHVAKVLHIHPESASALQAYLGKISHVELNGFSTATEAHRDFP